MRFVAGLSFVLLALAPVGLAQEDGLAVAIAELPSCALSCLMEGISASPCGFANQTCICTNPELNTNVQACVLKSCTLKEALTTKNITSTTCNVPIRSKNRTLKLTNIILGVLSATVVLARISFKAVFSAGEFGWDDYMIVATIIFGIPSTVILDVGSIRHGLGRDIWNIPLDEITTFLRWFYINEVLYFFNVSMLKLSLLFFFLRIFPAKPIQRLFWATIVFNIAFGTTFILVSMFQCTPVRYYWQGWDGQQAHGKCLNINAVGWANAAISIVLDLWMLAIPLWQVLHLKLSWKKKVSVAMMFGVGTFVTIISIVRLQTLISLGSSLNPTWDQADAANWSIIEINVGIICACMPALRLILVRLFPKAMKTAYSNTNKHSYANTGNSSRYGPGKSGHRASARASRMGPYDLDLLQTNPHGITYTTTIEIERGGDDEEKLVHGDDISSKGQTMMSSKSSIRSGNESEITADSPAFPYIPRRPS